MLSEDYTWRLIKSYIDTHGIVSHQIESFDHFIRDGIDRVLSEEPDVVIQKKSLTYRLSIGSVYVSKPTLIEEDRVCRDLFPEECRRRNLTYSSPVYADLTETYLDDGKEQIVEHKRVIIAKIPIMVRSSRCHLTTLTPKERIEHGECEYDNGGYFIVNGHERVLVAQRRSVYNKIMVLYKKKKDKIGYVSEIRSMSEETGHSVSTEAYIDSSKNIMTFSLTYIVKPIPFGIVFKALGFVTEEEIRKFIGLYHEDAEMYLKLIIKQSYFIETQNDALVYIGARATHVIKESNYKAYASQVVKSELFPHMGVMATPKEKAYLIGKMINKLLSTKLKLRCEDDRDNYMNKRVETSGVLCRDIFKILVKKHNETIYTHLQKKTTIPDIVSVISKTTNITVGMNKTFLSSVWGGQRNPSYSRVGVSQILSRLSYGGTLSHLCRLMIQRGKEGKNSKATKMRQINPSQIMYICPSETPEGQPVGIVLNMSLLTRITHHIPTVQMKEVIEDSPNVTSVEEYNGKGSAIVFLNGIVMGFVEDVVAFMEEFDGYRTTHYIDRNVSISYNDVDNEINVYCDEGRLIRPVFTVDCDKCAIKEEDGTDWDDLVERGLIKYIDNSEINDKVIAFDQKELKKYPNDYCEISAAMMLGVMASIIPFPDHSQSPRNCYQSSMGKQAMGMFALSHLLRSDTIAQVLQTPQRPLVSTKTSDILGFNDMPSGVNCVVAILPLGGFNQEDSVIMNRSAVERGLFASDIYKTYIQEDKKENSGEYTICIPPLDRLNNNYDYGMLNDNGVIKVGSYVKSGDVLIGRTYTTSTGEITDSSLAMSYDIVQDIGQVARVFDTTNANGFRLVKVIVRVQKIPEIGDKMASRSAQKGTIGMMYNQWDMPFTAEGITPDIIINPHCIPSRMTINQLLECVTGKESCMSGEFGDSTPFTDYSNNVSTIICDKLKEHGFERHGYERMYSGMTGEMIHAKVFIGPTYYQRLKHLVSDKIHARSKGPVTTLTRQPLEGRSRNGGLRFGEMERDCIIAHGTSRFLKERLFDQSDAFQVPICNICKNFATTQDKCRSCNSDLISTVNMPYASKLVIQELNAMGIKTEMVAKK